MLVLERFEGDGDTALVSVIVGSQNIGEPVSHQTPGRVRLECEA